MRCLILYLESAKQEMEGSFEEKSKINKSKIISKNRRKRSR